MANVTFINESDAPAAPVAKTKGNANQAFALDLLSQIKLGDKAARIGLEEGDSVRALKRAFTVVANGQNRAVNVRVVDEVEDGQNVQVLYVKEVKAKA